MAVLHPFQSVFIPVLILLNFLRVVQPTGIMDATGADVGAKLELVPDLYSIYRKRLSWGDAVIYCEKHEGHLATFVNMDGAKKVIDKIYEISEKVTPEYLSGAKTAEFGLDRRYWMGLTDLVSGEGNWVWAGKGIPLSYSLWYPGQPDHIDKNGKYIGRPEHCGALWNPIFHKGDRKHSFVDQECKRMYYFICEKDTDKLAKQDEYNKQNPGKDTKMGKGLASLLLRGREREHPDQDLGSQTQPQGRGLASAGRGLGRNANMLEHTNNKTKSRNKHAGKWAEEEGFKELFEPSESTSIEETKHNSVTNQENKLSTAEDEVSDVFSL